MAFAYLESSTTAGISAPFAHAPRGGPGPSGSPGGQEGKRREVDLLAIAQGFAVSAGDITELHNLNQRSWVLLAVTDLFEAWAIGWPPGGHIELHDHGQSNGAVTVVRGALTETTVRATDRGVALIGTHHVGAGDHRTFGPHYVHDLTNDGLDDAISVHVYGPKLKTMTYYEMDPHGRLDTTRTEDVTPIGPFDTTSVHDPS
jgi:predicted metal-dependent enzyme (double-stranded beta helix superfamily)